MGNRHASSSLFGGPDALSMPDPNVWYKPSIMVSHNRINLTSPLKLSGYFLNYESPRVINLCYDCAVGHELRSCNGSTQTFFTFCNRHRNEETFKLNGQDAQSQDHQILLDVRDFWRRKYEIGPLGLKFIRLFPPIVSYVHVEGCFLSSKPEVVIGDTSQSPASYMFFRNCYEVFANARGQVLKHDSATDRNLAAAHRWSFRQITVLQGLDERLFTEMVWSDANRRSNGELQDDWQAEATRRSLEGLNLA